MPVPAGGAGLRTLDVDPVAPHGRRPQLRRRELTVPGPVHAAAGRRRCG